MDGPILGQAKILLDGVPPTQYQEVSYAQLEVCLQVPERAPAGVLEILRQMAIVRHLACQALGGVGGTGGGGDPRVGPGPTIGGGPVVGSVAVEGAPGVIGRDPAVPLAIVPLSRFQSPPPQG